MARTSALLYTMLVVLLAAGGVGGMLAAAATVASGTHYTTLWSISHDGLIQLHDTQDNVTLSLVVAVNGSKPLLDQAQQDSTGITAWYMSPQGNLTVDLWLGEAPLFIVSYNSTERVDVNITGVTLAEQAPGYYAGGTFLVHALSGSPSLVNGTLTVSGTYIEIVIVDAVGSVELIASSGGGGVPAVFSWVASNETSWNASVAVPGSQDLVNETLFIVVGQWLIPSNATDPYTWYATSNGDLVVEVNVTDGNDTIVWLSGWNPVRLYSPQYYNPYGTVYVGGLLVDPYGYVLANGSVNVTVEYRPLSGSPVLVNQSVTTGGDGGFSVVTAFGVDAYVSLEAAYNGWSMRASYTFTDIMLEYNWTGLVYTDADIQVDPGPPSVAALYTIDGGQGPDAVVSWYSMVPSGLSGPFLLNATVAVDGWGDRSISHLANATLRLGDLYIWSSARQVLDAWWDAGEYKLTVVVERAASLYVTVPVQLGEPGWVSFNGANITSWAWYPESRTLVVYVPGAGVLGVVWPRVAYYLPPPPITVPDVTDPGRAASWWTGMLGFDVSSLLAGLMVLSVGLRTRSLSAIMVTSLVLALLFNKVWLLFVTALSIAGILWGLWQRSAD